MTAPPMAPTAPPGLGVRAEGLSFDYGSHRAVDRVDLHARPGEVFALLGTNGAGKTTTLELLQGYRTPAAGHVRVLGHDPSRERRALRRRTGFMLQEAGLVPGLTALESLRLWQRISSRADDPRTLLERVDLAHRADVPAERLSGGEKRRLDVALAIWGRPDLVVLDEPTTGLDPRSRSTLWDLVRDLRSGGTTVLLTTHYLEEAEQLADRVAIMHRGRVALAGPLPGLLHEHAATVAADLPAPDARGLPPFRGDAVTRPHEGRVRLEVSTYALQEDLTTLLTWAARSGVELTGLRAQAATLDHLFHLVRTGQEPAP